MKKTILLILALFAIQAIGQIPKPLPNTYVNDYTGVLSKDAISDLNNKIFELEKKSSVQLAIVIINKLPENMAIEDYARKIGRSWHVGNAKNGIVYVMAIADKKQRLEVSRNLEGDITDVYAHDITEAMKPSFRKGDYKAGLFILLEGINARVDPVVKEQLKLAAAESKNQADVGIENFYIVLFILAILAIVFLILFLSLVPRKKKESFQTHASNTERVHSALWDSPAYTKTPRYYSDDYSSSSSPSSNTYSDSGSSNSYGNWGSGSSDSSSSFDSGFSGGGSSNDW